MLHGIKRHAILHHGKRYDFEDDLIVPFPHEAVLEQARVQCCRLQMSSARKHRFDQGE